MKPHTLSTLLLVAGVALLVLGYFEPQISASFVEVVTDDTPPVWILDASGAPMLYPIDGAVYGTPVTNIRVGASDPESYITSVVATIDGTVYPLPFTGGLPGYGIYSYLLATPITSGQHSLSYVATNGVGLQTTYTGSFSFSTVIQGTWYVNGIEITSSIQTVYSSSLTVNFTFTRSSGPTTITCTVKEGGTSLLTLTSTDSSTWRGSYTFVGGSHTLSLVASDGITQVTMATLSVNFGGSLDFTSEQIVMFGAGACCLVGGGYLRLPKKKR